MAVQVSQEKMAPAQKTGPKGTRASRPRQKKWRRGRILVMGRAVPGRRRGPEERPSKSPFSPPPERVRGQEALGKRLGECIERGEFKRMLISLRREYPKNEEYASALISLGDAIFERGIEPREANALTGHVARRLFRLRKPNYECAAAFLCRAHDYASFTPEKLGMEALGMERKWGIVRMPGFVATADWLLGELHSADADAQMRAHERCTAMGVIGRDLANVVLRAQGAYKKQRGELRALFVAAIRASGVLW